MSSRLANLQNRYRRPTWSQRPRLLPGLRRRLLQKLIASVLLLTFTSMITLPAQAAAAQALTKPVSIAPTVKIANLSDALKDFHESLHKTQRNATAQDKAQAGASGIFTTIKNLASGTGPNALRHQGAQDLLSREAKISQLENQTRKDFAATLAHLQAAKLPATILQRHTAAVQQFESRSSLLHSKIAALRTADSNNDSSAVQTALNDIDSTLSQWEPKARQVDPKHLPWGSPATHTPERLSRIYGGSFQPQKAHTQPASSAAQDKKITGSSQAPCMHAGRPAWFSREASVLAQ